MKAKLCSRLLVTLVLLAVFSTVTGVGSASARGQSQPVAAKQQRKPAPTARPYSGEPDIGGQTAPAPKSSPSSATTPTSGDLLSWLAWLKTLGLISREAGVVSFERSARTRFSMMLCDWLAG